MDSSVTAPDARARRWEPAAAALLDPGRRGVVRILGGPGTGKSSLLLDVAAARIAAGTDPESVLVLTGSGRLGLRARGRLTAALLASAGPGAPAAVIRTPLVRSVHSYAFGVLQSAARRAGAAPPRLITGAEQDGIIRELLAGELEDGARAWPGPLRAALGTAGFATELRDLLARCAERGVDPQQLRRLGRLSGRPEWTAAGRFAQQYEQVMLLRSAVGTAAANATVPALGAAELVGAALEAFGTDPDLLAAEQTRLEVLLVDDAQHLDPQAARLVRVLAAGARTAVVAGDPHQAVFGFRGADPALLLADGTDSVTLRTSHRCAPAVAGAVSDAISRLPGVTDAGITSARTEPGSVSALVARSEHAEEALIADTLRRAHLVDGVPWSQMAVVVRSVPRAATGLPRVLTGAGVPVAAPVTRDPVAANPVVRALLTVLRATADGLTGGQAGALLTGPIGRVDPVSARRLRRTLRRRDGCTPPREFGDLLVEVLGGTIPGDLAPGHARPLRRLQAVLRAAAAAAAAGQDPRAVLWQAWHRSGLQRRLLTSAERGGVPGQRAGVDLDSVTGLFDIADTFVSRTAGASLSGLVDHVDGLRLPSTAQEPVEVPDAVTIVSAHAALGREWDLVVIAGLQEGLWPNTTPRGGVLGTQRLLDVLDGVAAEASLRAPLVAEERRLLIAAMGRARHRLVVTAVDGRSGADSGDLALPSPFFHDIAGCVTGGADRSRAADPGPTPTVLSAPAVVGRLRAVVCAPPDVVGDRTRTSAARQLARLAAAGVPGADPAEWYGMVPVSTDDPLWDADGGAVTVSPSALQTLQDCPLRWLLEHHGGRDPRELRSALGSLVHALVADPDKSEEQMLGELERVWAQLPFESGWFARNELARHRAMIATFARWREQTRPELTTVGTEVDVEGALDGGDPAGPQIRLRGRVDRLERDPEGRLVVVDVKTGRSPVSKDDAQEHAQLALYQLAIAGGLVPDGAEPGGARLVYVARPSASGATERHQDPLTPPARDRWRAEITQAVAATGGPRFVARVNGGCAHCPVRPGCPAHTERTGAAR